MTVNWLKIYKDPSRNRRKTTIYSSSLHIFRNILSFAHWYVKEFDYHYSQVSLQRSYSIECRLRSEMRMSQLKCVVKLLVDL